MGASRVQVIPLACEDWANTKAAYRFLSKALVNGAPILAGQIRAAARRTAACEELILVLQATTEFVYQRKAPEKICFTKYVNNGRDVMPRW